MGAKQRQIQLQQMKDRRGFLKQAFIGTGLGALVGRSSIFAQKRSGSATREVNRKAMQSAMAMALSAENFLNSLSSEQQATAIMTFEDEQRMNWHYVPKVRAGIPYKQMDQRQRQLADALLKAGLSRQGLQKASTIISLEPVLAEIEKGAGPVRDSELYYFAVFGQPRSSKPWGWRFEGHHISLNYTIIGEGGLAATPSFLGANPAEVQHGPHKGLRALPAEEDVARTLLKSLDDKQRAQAVISNTAPSDILSTNSRKAAPVNPSGLQADRLSGTQAEVLISLLDEHAKNMAPEIAAQRLARMRSAGFNNIHFAWAGEYEHGRPHYYSIQGPTFLIEYDNTQNNANHVHTVWRDFNGDFGFDLLADHYRNAHQSSALKH